MKKNTKRFWAILLAGAMTVGCLAGCGQTEKQETAETTVKTEGEAESAGKEESTKNEETEKSSIHPVTTEPITISIMTERTSTATNSAEDIWFFQYLEYWLAEQGYNVTIDIQAMEEPKQQIALMLGTESLPDLIWGTALSTSNTVIYGDGQGMILDWTPYLNETYMPNLTRVLEDYPAALMASTSLDGGIYGIPKLTERKYGTASSTLGTYDRVFINTTWLKECGLEMPTNIDEFLNMLRTFKSQMKVETEDQVTPVLSNKDLFEKALWIMMGYYGSSLSKYGNAFCIKNGELAYPVYSEDYKTFIEIMKTMYDEGLISEDHFSMDTTTMRGLSKAGAAGVVSDTTMENLPDYNEWECMPWFTIGDTEQVAVSLGAQYSLGRIWASANTKYPEVLALIVDYIYSLEGATMLEYGPMEGQDPLGMVDGWYMKEDGVVSTKMVDEGLYDSFEAYAYQYIRSSDNVGFRQLGIDHAFEFAGRESNKKIYEITDSITGETFVASEVTPYTKDNAQGYWFISNSEVSKPHITTVYLPALYMTEDDSLYATELKTVLDNHVASESAKFITGVRPVEEIDAFFEELKSMGVEEYIALYEEAYSSYLSTYFD